MFEKLLSSPSALQRHQRGPFAHERACYLQHCADSGATHWSLRVKSNELLWAARLIGADASDGVDITMLQSVVARRLAFQNAPSTGPRFIAVTRPWLRFLGWWQTPPAKVCESEDKLDQYCHWMRDERGFRESTITGWVCRVRSFLIWCDANSHQLLDLRASDIDDYFIDDGAHHWCRRTVANMAAVLKIFFRYAGAQGWCDPLLAQTIRGPRIYKYESLPFAPEWEDVQRLLASTLTDRPQDVRARAILLLLAVYGLRATEVATLRLDQLDWQEHIIRIFRLKRRQPQIYPLLPSVAQALRRYINDIRPSSARYPEVFIGLQSPQRPLTRAAIYKVVSRRFSSLNVEVAHHGPHALRHACATRLITDGFTIKEVGDHLGHLSSSATGTYAKVNLVALREVGDFDLGDLQ